MKGSDPLSAAFKAIAKDAFVEAMTENFPRLTRTRTETAAILGISLAQVDRMIAAGQLQQLAAGRLLLSSILQTAGWPLQEAPVTAPASSVPTEA